MPLTLVVGRANAGKTGTVFGAVREAVRGGLAPVVLFPSEPDVERACSELLPEIPLGLRISTFHRHVAHVWEMAGDGRKLVTPGQRSILLERLRSSDDDAVPGLEDLAARTIDRLVDALGARWREPRIIEGPARPLARLISGYVRALDEGGLIEPSEACHVLATGDSFGGDLIVAHRFTDFTNAQETFIRAAARGGLPVLATLPWEKGFAATVALTPLVERLANDASLVISTQAPVKTDPELIRVGEGIFESPQTGPLSEAISFWAADGEEAEASCIAERVAEALSAGVSPGEIAVVFRNPRFRVAQLSAALRERKIAADFDVLVPIAATPLGRALLQLLKFVCSGNATGILGFARSPFSGMSASEANEFERAVRTNRNQGAGRILAVLAEVSSVASREVRIFRSAARAGIDEVSARELGRSVRRMVGYAYAGSVRVAQAEQLAEDARVERAVVGLLEDAVSLGVGASMRSFEQALTRHEVGPDRVERAGHVQVTSVERARSRRFDTLILGGLEAGQFPASPEDPFSEGGAATGLLGVYGAGGPDGLGPGYERLLFYQVITRPRRKLVLVRRLCDSADQEVAPSSFWEELLDFYRPAVEGVPVDPGLVRKFRGGAALRDGAPQGERQVLRTAAARCQRDAHPRVARAFNRAIPEALRLEHTEALRDLAGRDVFSASELELYLSCPLRWFYERLVRPAETDVDFDAREQGKLAHEMLRAAYGAIVSGLPEARVTAGNLLRARALAETACAEVEGGIAPATDFSETLERRRLRRAVDRLIENDATLLPTSFRPIGLEWSFGDDRGTDLGAFRLRGRIDRVDSDDTHAVIIDYKTGEPPARAKLLEAGRIQAQLYAEVVRVEQGLVPVGSIYWSLKGGKPRGLIDASCLEGSKFTTTDCGDADQMSLEIQKALEMAADAVEGIRAGRIDAEPRVGACQWCKAGALCERGLRCKA